MKQSIDVLVVADESGTLRPLAGLWKDNESGKLSSEEYLKKSPGTSIIPCSLIQK